MKLKKGTIFYHASRQSIGCFLGKGTYNLNFHVNLPFLKNHDRSKVKDVLGYQGIISFVMGLVSFPSHQFDGKR